VLTIQVSGFSGSGSLKAHGAGLAVPPNGSIVWSSGDTGSGGFATTAIVQPGADGKVHLTNTSTTGVQVRVAVQGWFTGVKTGTEAELAEMDTKAAALGAPAELLEFAHWRMEILEQIPTDVVTSTEVTEMPDDDLIDETLPENDEAPAPPVGVEFEQGDGSPTSSSPLPVQARAANGTCYTAGGYKFYEVLNKKVAKNRVRTVWTATQRLRWCGNANLKRIASTHSRIVYTLAPTTAYWDLEEIEDRREEAFAGPAGFRRQFRYSDRYTLATMTVPIPGIPPLRRYYRSGINGWADGGFVKWFYEYDPIQE
jgi:hypothetical protein